MSDDLYKYQYTIIIELIFLRSSLVNEEKGEGKGLSFLVSDISSVLTGKHIFTKKTCAAYARRFFCNGKENCEE